MKQNPKNILAIRFSAMGDVALVVPVLLALTRHYPAAKITLLSKPFFKPIVEHIPNVSFIGMDTSKKHKGIVGLFKLFWVLKNHNFDAVADIHNVLRSKIIRFLFKIFYLKSIKIAVIDKGRAEKKALTKPEKKVLKPLKHTAQRYADVFKNLGLNVDLELNLTKQKEDLSTNILNITHTKTEKWIGIAPFAQHTSKIYPEASMLKVLELIKEYSLGKILMFAGGKTELEILEKWQKRFPFLIIIAGKLTFEEELKLISNLDIMLSMDSGNGHLAAMFGVPVVTLWGGTHPFLGFAPYNQPIENQMIPDLEKYPFLPLSIYGNKTLKGYEDVMQSIQPEKIVDRIKVLLDDKVKI